MRRLSTAAFALWCSVATAHAQEAEREDSGPDLDFLEYLGTWAEEDDEWLAIEEWERDNGNARDDSKRREPERRKDDDDDSE